MKLSNPQNSDTEFEPFIKLIQVMRDDPLINEKLIEMLNMKSYNRRMVLNNWLEELRRQKASGNLRQALSCFHDDEIAETVLKLINHRRKKTDTESDFNLG